MNDRGDRSATKRAATASRDPVRVVCWEQRPPIILGLQRIEISGHRPQRPTRRDGATTQRIQSLDMLLPDANACAPAAEDVTLNQYGRTVHENVSGFLWSGYNYDSTSIRLSFDAHSTAIRPRYDINELEFGMYPQSMPTEWTHARTLRPWQSVRLDLWRLVLRGL